MFNWLKKWLQPVADDSRKALKHDIEEIEAHINELIEDEKREAEFVNLQVWVGKPIIIISNSDSNITLGFGKDITFISRANNPVLVFDDYSSDPSFITEKISMSNCIMFYDIHKLKSLLKLDNNDVAHLFFGKYSYQGDEVEFKSKPRELSLQMYLERNNFAKAVEWYYKREPYGR